jgi:hypothetical protein
MPAKFTRFARANPRFSGFSASDDFLSKEHYHRRLAFRLLTALAVLLLLVTAETLALVRSAHQPPPIIGYAAGYLFKAKPVAPVWDVKDYQTQFRDTIEALFRRTEKGSLPELEDFVGPQVKEYVDARYTRIKKQYPAGFIQTFNVLEERSLGFSPAEGMKMTYRGVWMIRTATGMEATVIYLAVSYGIGKPTPFNATGWRLNSLKPITEDEFFAEERSAEHQQRLELSTQPASPSVHP